MWQSVHPKPMCNNCPQGGAAAGPPGQLGRDATAHGVLRGRAHCVIVKN